MYILKDCVGLYGGAEFIDIPSIMYKKANIKRCNAIRGHVSFIQLKVTAHSL